MTSEAIDESAVNVFISAFALGSGTARRCLESSPAGANEPNDMAQLKPGRRTATVRFQNDLHYSFTMSPAQCASRSRLRIFGECVREASLQRRPGRIPGRSAKRLGKAGETARSALIPNRPNP